MIRMTALMKKVYGEKEYKKKELVDWVDVSKKASYLGAPEQGPNECGFFVLKMAQFYDGKISVVKLGKRNASIFILASNVLFHLSLLFCSSTFVDDVCYNQFSVLVYFVYFIARC